MLFMKAVVQGGTEEIAVGSMEMRVVAVDALAEVCQTCNKFIWPYVPALQSLLTHMQEQYHLDYGTYVHVSLCSTISGLRLQASGVVRLLLTAVGLLWLHL